MATKMTMTMTKLWTGQTFDLLGNDLEREAELQQRCVGERLKGSELHRLWFSKWLSTRGGLRCGLVMLTVRCRMKIARDVAELCISVSPCLYARLSVPPSISLVENDRTGGC
jgi:hypothetical protein